MAVAKTAQVSPAAQRRAGITVCARALKCHDGDEAAAKTDARDVLVMLGLHPEGLRIRMSVAARKQLGRLRDPGAK